MKRFVLIFLGIILGIIVSAGLFVGGIFFYFSIGLPNVKSLEDYRPKTISYVYDRNGVVVAEFFDERRIVTPLDKVPVDLAHAFIASEDSHYYQHKGIDFQGITRAMFKNIEAGKIVQGGSTITQQVARALLLTRRRTWTRKIREAILAYRIEHYLTKDEILTIYLNQLYLGNGAYGVEAAAQNYFAKHVWELSLGESAILAGLPRAPSLYSPVKHPDRARKRRAYVLGRMYEDHYITRQQMDDALAEPIKTVKTINPFYVAAPYYSELVRQYVVSVYGRERLYSGGLKIHTYLDLGLQKAARESIEKGLRALDKRQGFRGAVGHVDLENDNEISGVRGKDPALRLDLKAGSLHKAVIVKCDSDRRVFYLRFGGVSGKILPAGYKWARKRPVFSVNETKKEPQDLFKVLKPGDVVEVRLRSKTPEGWLCGLEQEPLAQSALISMDVKSGAVLAMVGGYRFGENQFNRAVQSKRQPGSAFKPVIYAAALDKGLTTASIILDSPIIYRQFAQKAWKPENYEEHFYGPTTLREGLVHSRNVVTVKILRKIGISYVLKYVRGLGITAKLSPDLSLALGSSAMSLKELMLLYGIFARGGWNFEPLFVEKIVDWDGKILEEHPVSTNEVPTETVKTPAENPETDQEKPENIEEKALLFQPKHVMDPQTSYILTTILEDVVKRGTGWRARVLKRPCAGKTGTTSSYRDAWFMGYTPQILTGVWVGFDNEISLGKHETGSRAACPIWTTFMLRALKNIPKMEFSAPPGIVYVSIDPKTGLLARPKTPHAYLECFKEGTEPRDYTGEVKKSKPLEFFQLDQ